MSLKLHQLKTGDKLADEKNQSSKDFFISIDEASETIGKHVEQGEFIRVVSHLDADGVSAASIMGKALHRAEAFYRIRIVKQLDEESVETLAGEEGSLLVFTDLGSGSLDLLRTKLAECELIVLDHHKPMEVAVPNLVHVNPHLSGYDGAREISGAGVAYLTAKAMDESNVDSAPLAVVGALGDSQDKNSERELKGLNKEIVRDAVKAGYIQVEKDLIFYGRETRSIHKALAYTTDPFIPGLSCQEDKCLGFLVNLGIKLKNQDRWRAINDLTVEEKQSIFSEIAKYLSSKGSPDSIALRLIGTVYTLVQEDRWTPMRDGREYASFLNACGRMGRGGLGVAIGIGSRGEALDEALEVHSDYKRTLSEYVDWVTRTPGTVRKLDNIYVIDGSGVIDELIIGTIASILSNSGSLDEEKPIVALTSAGDDIVKVSGRTPSSFGDGRVNLGSIFQEVSTKLNGRGGGHDVAAGAQVPREFEDEFIRLVDKLVGSMLKAEETR
jgi:single-stranded-DNA-specific exonuclease